MGAIFKVSFKDWFQYQQHRRLHHSISHRRNAQRPQFSIRFGDVDPPHRLSAVGPLLKAPLDFFHKGRFLFSVYGDLFDAYSIYARCSAVAPYCCPRGLQHIVPAHQSVETVEEG
jgi:hypothetical protein